MLTVCEISVLRSAKIDFVSPAHMGRYDAFHAGTLHILGFGFFVLSSSCPRFRAFPLFMCLSESLAQFM